MHARGLNVAFHVTVTCNCGIVALASMFLVQCLLRSPVHPYPSPGAGELAASVAEHAQSVQDQRHLLLLLCHGALHQRLGHPDRDTKGQNPSHTACHMWFTFKMTALSFLSLL